GEGQSGDQCQAPGGATGDPSHERVSATGTATGNVGECAVDARDRQVVHKASVLWLSADDEQTAGTGMERQSQTDPTADACDGDRRDLPGPEPEQTLPCTIHPSLLVARSEDRTLEPGVGNRHHVFADGQRLYVSLCDHRLVQPQNHRL